MQYEVYKLLDDIGKALTLRKFTSTYSNGAVTRSNTDYAITGTLVAYKDNVIDGSTIQREDRKALISSQGLAMVPVVNDEIIEGSKVYSIISVNTVEKGGVDVAFICQCRG